MTECLQSLRFDEFEARRNFVGKSHTHTGKWLDDDPAYREWEDTQHSSLLLIRGKPGSGKSTLAKYILEMKEEKHQVATDTAPVPDGVREVLAAAFFYSIRGEDKQTDQKLMLQSLLYQLPSQDTRLFVLFRDIYRSRRASTVPFTWEESDLRMMLESLASLTTHKKIYIFVDAMDESDDQGRPEILRLLSKLCTESSNCHFKVLVATRPLPRGTIDKKVGHWHIIDLEEKNRGDIEEVVKSGLEKLKRTSFPMLDFSVAKDYMIKNSSGVFLWVALVLNMILNCISSGGSQGDLEELLNSLPQDSDLENMYRRIVDDLVKRTDPPFGKTTYSE